MEVRLSTKGQIVLPAGMRRRLGLQARSKVEIEEREEGLFIRPAGTKRRIAPIEYLPPGSVKLSEADYELDRKVAEDDQPL
ncbi:MAG TPA: AbrB/MazE/SpoVT family DNA-binding domain-containing protein [Opitutaceae bacterium]|jgi:AbrB family looped-hinge helix DNA binding protein|nr:AbrB/MazE/SpoVT family DNA-binding domain-containing protein [Opitutaceae bacterium]